MDSVDGFKYRVFSTHKMISWIFFMILNLVFLLSARPLYTSVCQIFLPESSIKNHKLNMSQTECAIFPTLLILTSIHSLEPEKSGHHPGLLLALASHIQLIAQSYPFILKELSNLFLLLPLLIPLVQVLVISHPHYCNSFTELASGLVSSEPFCLHHNQSDPS